MAGIGSIIAKLGRGIGTLGRELVDNLLIKAWERVFGPIFGNPEKIPEKIAEMLRSYTAMKLAGLTTSELDDLYQFAMEQLWRRNAVAHDRLLERHQQLGDGITGLRSGKARQAAKNRAQRRFQIAAVILPLDPKTFGDLDNIQPYVDACVARLEWYAMMSDTAWAAWVDVFNFEAEEVEKKIDGLVKTLKKPWRAGKRNWRKLRRSAKQAAPRMANRTGGLNRQADRLRDEHNRRRSWVERWLGL